jgi:2-methylisocitrate lyase-like PEP mutase family enzyme
MTTAVVDGPAAVLRAELASGRLAIAPGVYDVVTAKVLDAAGCTAAYLTPFGFRASDEGPGKGPGRAEGGTDAWQRVLRRVEAIRESSGLAVLLEGCSGLEGDRSAPEVCRDAADAGAAAVVIEDREAFGRDHPILSPSDMQRHLDAARASAGDDLVIIARTDSVRDSLPDALARCRAYLDAGADLVMPLMTPYLAYPQSAESRARMTAAYDALAAEVPPSRTVVHSPLGRHLAVADARAYGFAVYLMPQLLIASGVSAMLGSVLAHDPAGTGAAPEPLLDPVLDPEPLAELVGIDRWLKARW